MPNLSRVLVLLLLAACSTGVQDQPTETPKEAQMSEATEPEKSVPDQKAAPRDPKPAAPGVDKIVKTDEEWRRLLSPEEYHVTRQAGTERAFTGRYWNKKDAGSYACVCCGLVLFESDTKYDSGCGWPSFWKTLAQDRVVYLEDLTYGMARTEVQCARCDAHLGHVFEDGPEPTGQRYCMNSVSLRFIPDDK